MKEMILQILQMLLSMFEIWLCNQLLFATVIEKEILCKKEKSILLINVLVTGTLLSVNRNILFFSGSMLGLCIIITCSCVIYVKRNNKILSCLVVTLYYLLLTLLDFFFAFIAMIFLGSEYEKTIYFYTISFSRCVIYLCSRIIIMGLIWGVNKFHEIKKYIEEFKKLLVIICIVLCVMEEEYHNELVEMTFGFQSMQGGIASISLICALVIVLFIGIMLLKSKMIQKENEILLLRDEMLRKNYRELEQQLEQSRRLIHDIKNHFLILKDYENKNDYEGIHDYLKKMEQNYFNVNVYAWTGNQTVDFVLEQQKEKAKEQGIQFQIEAVPVSGWNLDDSELCSLFGNLLDNAIEACESIVEDEKRIKVKIERQNQLIFIRIQNTFSKCPKMKNGRLISSKEEKTGHGYGLKNVERIVKKYEGEISYQIAEKEFQANITFFNFNNGKII